MKAVTIWQPWASAIATGAKRIETRGWRTNHRGRIAIHAAKTMKGMRMLEAAMPRILDPWPDSWREALRPLLRPHGRRDSCDPRTVLPFGSIVAVASIVDCVPTEDLWSGKETSAVFDRGLPRIDEERRLPGAGSQHGHNLARTSLRERDLGDFGAGRFAWILDHVESFETPIACTGRQGIFNLDRETETAVLTHPRRAAA